MKNLLILFLIFPFCFAIGQSKTHIEPDGGGEYNIEKTACISENQTEQIKSQLVTNLKDLGLYKSAVERSIVKFIWPVQTVEGFDDPGFLGISNFVDHDEESSGNNNNNVLDYQCGNRSYDTGSGYNHRGIDIFTWPFPWQKMDEDLVEVIAAAPGVIILSEDGFDDRSCDFCTNCSWNAIYVRHNDGSVAWYGHLKKNSLTSKGVGESVVAGEYLGIVGSSGNSTGPHLHFEVWEDDSFNNLIDPYEGNCNNSISESWWENQPPYWESGINKVTLGDSAPSPNGCGEQWSRNEEDQFFAGQTLYIGGYFRDQITGTSATYSILRPDGSEALSWTQNFINTFSGSWWWFNRTIPFSAEDGIWSVRVEYEDDVEEVYFMVGKATSTTFVAESEYRVFPNPFDAQIYLEMPQHHIAEVEIFNTLGELMRVIKTFESQSKVIFDGAQLASGVYFLRGKTESGKSFARKMIKS